MNETPASKRSRFTPRKKISDTPSERRLPLSLLLLGVSTALAVAVTSWLSFLANGKDVSLEIKEVERAETGEVQLTGARYLGLTPSGKHYEITAALANESADGSGWIDMDEPAAIVTMRNGSILNLRSDVGVFNKQTDVMTMSGTVVVVQPDRKLRLDTEALEANLEAGEMRSDVPVLVQDVDRRINADSMKVYDNGSRIIFGGTAKMIIEKQKNPPSESVDKFIAAGG